MSKVREVEKNEALLRQRFYVDSSSKTGLRWNENAPRGKRRLGNPAGYLGHSGYFEVEILKLKMMAHRIVWILCKGNIPDGMTIDHSNGNRSDNRIENLQLMSYSANNRARNGLSKNNTSAYVGVYWHKPAHKWMATCHREKRIHLGYFNSPIRAARAYNKAVTEWADEHGETPRYLNPV
jgi:hypothetical protein